ncbi:MAG: cache domain-containing protein, partial [Psychromonas sp.]|nr:cache domain-containing protein [Psychromonas sp.]
MKSLGFKKTIIISIIILVTLCLLTSNWIAYNNLKEQTIQGISEHSKTVVDYEAKKVETWFAARITVIKSLANHYEKQTHSNDQAHHDDYISTTKLTKKIGQLSDIFLGFADGSMYGSATGDGWTDGVANPEEFDPRTRPWYKQANSTNSAVLKDIYSDAFTGNPIISIAKDFGNGVVVGDVSLSILIDTVKDINFPGAISIVFDQTGTALASSSSAAVKIGDKLSSIGLGKLQSTILSQDESSLSYTLDGIDKVAFTKAINLTDGKKWYLFIGVDKSVVYAQIDQALNDAI